MPPSAARGLIVFALTNSVLWLVANIALTAPFSGTASFPELLFWQARSLVVVFPATLLVGVVVEWVMRSWSDIADAANWFLVGVAITIAARLLLRAFAAYFFPIEVPATDGVSFHFDYFQPEELVWDVMLSIPIGCIASWMRRKIVRG